MKPERVLCAISSGMYGGAERQFISLLKGLREAGIEAFAAIPTSGPLLAEFEANATASIRIDFSRVYDPRPVSRLRDYIKRTAVGTVHTHLWNADVLGGLAARAVGGTAAVSTVHGAYHLIGGGRPPQRARRALLSRSYRAIYRIFDRILAVSEFVRGDLTRRSGLKALPDRITVVNPGIDLRPPQSPRDVTNGPPTIACIANFHPVKGHDFLLAAMPFVLSSFHDARLLLVGEGPERSRLEGLARRLSVQSAVEFTGPLQSPLELLARATVSVLPSLSEGFPVSILESWAMKTPVVATQVGGVPELVENETTGILVPPAEPAALGKALARLLGDPGLRRRLASASEAALLASYSAERMVAATIGAYRAAVADRRR